MKKIRKTEDEKNTLIFDYDNFVAKSSQQRYYELKKEVKNKIEKINDDINITGSNEKEKKYNLLMHYKYMMESFDANRKESRLMTDILLSFIKDAVLLLTVVYSVLFSCVIIESQNTLKSGLLIIVIAAIIIVTVTYLYYEHIRNEKEKFKKDSQKFLYYKFYYKELKKYIKEY